MTENRPAVGSGSNRLLDYNTRGRIGTLFESPLVIHFVILWTVFLITFPIAWDVITAFKTQEGLYDLTYLPTTVSVQAFVTVLLEKQYWRAILNSVVISTVTTAIVLILAVPAGYGFSRFRFPFDNWIFGLVLVARMFPPIGLIVPYYQIMIDIGLLNTRVGIIVANVYLWLPLMIYIMRNFFISIPVDLEESARVDGCTNIQAFVHIAVPLAKPGIASVGILTFLYSWREFLFGFIVSSDLQSMPISVAAYRVIGDAAVQFTQLGATAVIAMIPPIIVVVLFQKHIVSGLTSGALKG